MHSHQVFFYLNAELSQSALLEFEEGLEALINIPLVRSGYYGKPAHTDRAVVDNTYSYGLTLLFKNTADHDLYQADPIHQVFLDKNVKKWARVQVFDVETKQ
jgi:hypothetical protein